MSSGETTLKVRDAQLYMYGSPVAVIGIAAIMTAFLLDLVRLTAPGGVAAAASAMFASPSAYGCLFSGSTLVPQKKH